MFDTSQEILIEGTVARLDWVNPHMYLIVETEGPGGQPALVEGEGLGITQALVDGLDREALKVGTPVVVRANPNRGGWGKQVRVLDVKRLTLTEDRTRLRYEITVEDPVYLSGPATLAQQWDHRPDLEFSQNVGACDPEVADRYREHVPK
jgi:hypothetical protein